MAIPDCLQLSEKPSFTYSKEKLFLLKDLNLSHPNLMMQRSVALYFCRIGDLI